MQPLRETPKGNEAGRVAGSKGGVDGSSLKYCGDLRIEFRWGPGWEEHELRKHKIEYA